MKLSKKSIDGKRRSLAAIERGMAFWTSPKKWVKEVELSNSDAYETEAADLVMGCRPACACAIGVALIGAAEVTAAEKKASLPKFGPEFSSLEAFKDAMGDAVNGFGDDAETLRNSAVDELDRDVPEEFGGIMEMNDDAEMTLAKIKGQFLITTKRLRREIKTGKTA